MGLRWVFSPTDNLSLPYIKPMVHQSLFPIIAQEPLTILLMYSFTH